jgi:hypothetical protein
MRANPMFGSRTPLLAGVAVILRVLSGAPGLLGALGRLRLPGELGLAKLLGAQAIGELPGGLDLRPPGRRGVRRLAP